LREKYWAYKNIEIIQSSYEKYDTPQRFDLIFSACALHWVPKNIAIEQSCGLLADHGWLVGVWCMPRFEDCIYEIIKAVIHPVYAEFHIPQGTQEEIDLFELGMQSLVNQGGFTNFSKVLYHESHELDADSIVHLVWSYMDIDKLSSYGADNLFTKLKDAVFSLAKNSHQVKSVLPVSYAQKISKKI